MAQTNFLGPLALGGVQVLTTQQATEADVTAIATYTPPAAGGVVAVTSIAATDLDTANAALKTLRDEVAGMRTTVNNLLAKLRTHGIIAT